MFRSTRPRGARPGRVRHQAVCGGFDPRAPAGRDGRQDGSERGAAVSIHAPPRGATIGPKLPKPSTTVSIHAPPRGATFGLPRPALAPFVSIHAPPRGATPARMHDVRTHRVSIHAPPRGATPDVSGAARSHRVSIHAPPRGATGHRYEIRMDPAFRSTRPRGARRRFVGQRRGLMSFDPRAPAGRDGLQLHENVGGRLSIHAPPRGATRRHRHRLAAKAFRSTRPRGARLVGEMRLALLHFFRSTRPRGARQAPGRTRDGARAFDPRAPAGRDMSYAQSYREAFGELSIHAPPRGATCELVPPSPAHDLFRSTRPRGARHHPVSVPRIASVFRSTRPRGARRRIR